MFAKIRRTVLQNYQLSEALNSNIQTLLTFMPGRWNESELFYESS